MNLFLKCKILLIVIILSSISVFADVELKFYGNNYISTYTIDSIIEGRKTPINDILSLYSENGFPFTEIITDSAITIGNKTIVYLNIIENGKYYIRSIVNNGNISTSLINSIIKLRGYTYSESKIKGSINDLGRILNIEINDIFYYPVIYNNDSVIIISDINDNAVSNISGVFATGFLKNDIYGFIHFNINSPHGYRRKYHLYYERSPNNMSMLNLFASFPFIFGFPLSIGLNGGYNDIDSLFTNADGEIALKILYEKSKIGFIAGKKWIFGRMGNSEQISYTKVGTSFDYLNSEHFEFNSLYEYFIGDIDYSKIDIDFDYIINKYNFFFRNRIKEVSLIFVDSVMEYMKTGIGGTNSVRGYGENILKCSDLLELSFDPGYNFSKNLSILLFSDICFYSDTGLPYLFKKYLLSYGTGFIMKNNKLELGLFYGIPYKSMITEGRIHIDLDYRF